MNIDNDIKKMKNIIRKAEKESPTYINGLIIPARYEDMFYYLLNLFMKKAKDAEKYFKEMHDMTIASQKATNDFMISFIKSINDGEVKFNEL